MKESSKNPTKTEVDVAIKQIIAMEESAVEQHDLEDGEKQDKMEGDKLEALSSCSIIAGTIRLPLVR